MKFLRPNTKSSAAKMLINMRSHLSPVFVVNTLRPRQNGRHFADDTFKRISLNKNVRILIKSSLKFVPKGPINNIPALVQIMAWRRPGDKPLSEPMMVSLLTHICITRPQWINMFQKSYFHTAWKSNPIALSIPHIWRPCSLTCECTCYLKLHHNITSSKDKHPGHESSKQVTNLWRVSHQDTAV